MEFFIQKYSENNLHPFIDSSEKQINKGSMEFDDDIICVVFYIITTACLLMKTIDEI